MKKKVLRAFNMILQYSCAYEIDSNPFYDGYLLKNNI